MSSNNDMARFGCGTSAFGHHSQAESNRIQSKKRAILQYVQTSRSIMILIIPFHLNPHKLATVRHSKLGRFSSWLFSPGLASLVGCSNRLCESGRNYTRGQCLWIPDATYPGEVLLPPACDFTSSASHSFTTRLEAHTPIKHTTRYTI
jgi:hypothetical protein